MSLGGYKFAGYKCHYTSGMSDGDLSLLMHKTRLMAFVKACKLSGANWHFCLNTGTIPFSDGETDYGNVIYHINNGVYNYASFVQYGDEDKYIAILSIPEQSSFSPGSGIAQAYADYGSGNKQSWWYRSMHHCASMSPFDANHVDFMRNGQEAYYPVHALSLQPLTKPYIASGLYGFTPDSHRTFFNCLKSGGLTAYFGYAIKGSKIITFAATNEITTSPSTYLSEGLLWINLIGFGAMILSSDTDQYNIFHAVLSTSQGGDYECDFIKKTNFYVINECLQTLTSTGERFAQANKPSRLYINTSGFAGQVYGVSDKLALSSCYITHSENGNPSNYIRTVTPYLTDEGYTSKGMVDIDFLASAVTNDSSQLNSCKPYANGNYILGCKDFGQNMQYYIGWDPSNPDITQESAWTAYTE